MQRFVGTSLSRLARALPGFRLKGVGPLAHSSSWLVHFLVGICAIGACFQDRVLIAGDEGEAWAKERLEWLGTQPKLAWPYLNESGDFDFSQSFQFEYQFIYDYRQPQQAALRWLLEKDRDFTLVSLSKEGMPLYVTNHNRLIVFDNSSPDPSLYTADCSLEWSVRRLADIAKQPGFSTGQNNPLSIDFGALLDDLKSAASVVGGDPAAQLVVLRKHNSSYAEVHFTRERVPEQFPVKEIRIVG